MPYRSEEMKEHSQQQAEGSIRRMEMSVPNSRSSLDKKLKQRRYYSLEKSRRTDELVTAERDDREAQIAATGGVKAGNATSGQCRARNK